MKRYFRTEAHNKAGVVVKNTFLEVHPFDVWSLDIIFDVKFQCWLSRACQVGDHIPSLHDWCGNLVPVFFFCISWSSQPRRRQLSEPAGNSEPASLMASCIHPVNKGVLHSSCEHWDTFQDWCATDHYTVIANVFSASFYMTFIWFVDSPGWLGPWQSAVECVFSGENLHQCGSGWGRVQTFGVVDFKGCWSGCWVHQTIDHWLLQNYCIQRCFVY